LYYSSWEQAEVLYRDLRAGGEWTQVSKRRNGSGRTAGEREFRVDGIASNGGEVELVFTDGSGNWDNAPAPPQDTSVGANPAIPVPYQDLEGPFNYLTSLDVFLVQDGNLFTYRPAASVSAPAVQLEFVTSTQAQIPSRNIRVYLPRGYAEHTSKKYPVVYMHDGQNVFYPGGSFGTWDADRIASHETAMGRMRESIIVAVDNAGAARIAEYTPPSDEQATSAGNDGIADAYLGFLIDDVKASVDADFRTLCFSGGVHVPSEASVLGSSMGGLVSDYITLNRHDVFGAAGVMSAAYWTSPNFANIRDAAAIVPRRLHLTIGTTEGAVSFWNDSLRAYDSWMTDGYVFGSELQLQVGCGAGHNEAAWSAGMPGFYHHILNPWLEANWLLEELYPPQLAMMEVVSGTAHFTLQARKGISYQLMRNGTLSGVWIQRQSTTPVFSSWRTISFQDSGWPASDPKQFWRVTYPVTP